MKFTTTLLATLGALAFTSAETVSVSYDTVYDNASGALTSVACSDGSNGLITKYKYNTFVRGPSTPPTLPPY